MAKNKAYNLILDFIIYDIYDISLKKQWEIITKFTINCYDHEKSIVKFTKKRIFFFKYISKCILKFSDYNSILGYIDILFDIY